MNRPWGPCLALAVSLSGAGPWDPSRALAAPTPEGPSVVAPSAVVLEAGDGQVLWSRGAQVVRAPASMAKLMTLVLAVEALRRGEAHAKDLVSVSERAYRTGGSQIWLEPGETLPLQQLLVAIAVGSANDAAVAVAEHLAGNVEAFVERMNAKARALGMTHTRFVNPSGLDAPGHPTRTTALDMARLGAYASRYPELLRLTSLREDRSLRNGKGGTLWLVNHNRLLGQIWGLDGLKTGYTRAAGFCLAATARRQGLRLVAVVMGDPTSRQRFDDARHLLEWGFAHFRAAVAAHAGARLAWASVAGGEPPRIPAVVQEDLAFTVAVGSQEAAARPHLRVHLKRLRAPVHRGQVVGAVEATLGARRRSAPLRAGGASRRATFGETLRRLWAGAILRRGHAPATDGPTAGRGSATPGTGGSWATP